MSGDLSQWTPCPLPGREPITGTYVRVEPIVDNRHFDALFDSYAADAAGALWRWMPYGPFADRQAFERFAERTYLGADPLFHAIVPAASGRAEGVAALMRMDAANGVIETGHIALGPGLMRTPAATESFYLLMSRVFDELGYRRYEWKCNDRNAPSKRAAERLGFRPEGVFRQHLIVKGENRDTAWYSVIDAEWPALSASFKAWLEPANFSADGTQKQNLASIRTALSARPTP